MVVHIRSCKDNSHHSFYIHLHPSLLLYSRLCMQLLGYTTMYKLYLNYQCIYMHNKIQRYSICCDHRIVNLGNRNDRKSVYIVSPLMFKFTLHCINEYKLIYSVHNIWLFVIIDHWSPIGLFAVITLYTQYLIGII